MIVIISGVNRVEFCNVKKKTDFDRRFFMTRGQLYFVPSDGLTRMRIYAFGKERPSEACIAYRENEIIPYDTCGRDYCMDNLLADIDRYKEMTDYGLFKNKKPWFTTKGPEIWKFLTSGGGIAIIVLLWVFLSR